MKRFAMYLSACLLVSACGGADDAVRPTGDGGGSSVFEEENAGSSMCAGLSPAKFKVQITALEGTLEECGVNYRVEDSNSVIYEGVIENEQCSYQVELYSSDSYKITLSKEGFAPWSESFNAEIGDLCSTYGNTTDLDARLVPVNEPGSEAPLSEKIVQIDVPLESDSYTEVDTMVITTQESYEAYVNNDLIRNALVDEPVNFDMYNILVYRFYEFQGIDLVPQLPMVVDEGEVVVSFDYDLPVFNLNPGFNYYTLVYKVDKEVQSISFDRSKFAGPDIIINQESLIEIPRHCYQRGDSCNECGVDAEFSGEFLNTTIWCNLMHCGDDSHDYDKGPCLAWMD